MVGEIYLAKIYFTDLSNYKIRPVLVIKTLGEDCMCLQLTSQLHHPGIVISNSDLVDGVLKKSSMLLVTKSFTLHSSVLTKYLARINTVLLDHVLTRLCQELGCS